MTAGNTTGSLDGCRILVVEDELLIAVVIEEILLDLGCIVVGPISRLDVALQRAKHDDLEGAILDVNIRGDSVYPVAEELLSRGVPFVLSSGYADWALPEEFRNQLRLTKPFRRHDLEEQVRRICGK
jgi:two-component SAPR family response regulator